MKAIILARVSTEEQKDAGNSLPAQVARIEDYCDRKDFKIAKKFVFDESAYKKKRDEFDKVLDFLRDAKEKYAICFDKVDRLSRNVFDKRVSLLYEKAVADEIELHFVSDGQVINSKMSAVEKFQFGNSLGLAKYYSDAISDNVHRAFEQKRRKGEWTGPAPFGYLNVALNAEKRLRKDLMPDPVRAPVVRELFDKYCTGTYSVLKLAEELERREITTIKGIPVRQSVVHFILQNPFYYGEVNSRKYGMYPHKYEPLITKDLFLKVQEMFARKNRNPIKTQKRKEFIFGGLLKCLKCGCSMSAEITKGKYVYYSCTNAKRICKREYVNEMVLLEPIQEVLKSIRLSDAQIEQIVAHLKKHHEYQSIYHRKQISALRGEYDAIQGKLQKLLDLLIDGSITQDIYDNKLKVFKDRQYDLGIQLEDYTKADEKHYITAFTVLNLAQRAEEIFESSEIPEKRQLLKYLLQNPTVKDKRLVFSLKSPFDAIVDFPVTPLLRGLDSNQ